jgi:hypothetical protein
MASFSRGALATRFVALALGVAAAGAAYADGNGRPGGGAGGGSEASRAAPTYRSYETACGIGPCTIAMADISADSR